MHDPAIVKTLNALADFAFFSGVGAKTTMGCGIARRMTSNGLTRTGFPPSRECPLAVGV
ncbi:MAG: hypothetical protein AB7G75_28000 [Candidatus Binatia bacterium]